MTDFLVKRQSSYNQNLMRKLDDTVRKYEQYEKIKQEQISNYTLSNENQLQVIRSDHRTEGFRALYPGLMARDVPDQYSFLVNPENLSQLLRALYQENQLQQEELQNCCEDLFKFINLNDTLIEENQGLVKHIAQKNQDIKLLVESYTLNECEEINDLKHLNQLSLEENDILTSTLEQMKKKEQEQIQQYSNINNRLSEYKQQIEQLQGDIQLSQQREEEMTKKIFLMQPNIDELNDILNEQSIQLNEYKKQIDYYQDNNKLLNNKINEMEDYYGEKIIQDNEIIQKQQYKINKDQLQLENLEKQLKIKISDNEYYVDQINNFRKEIYELNYICTGQEEEIKYTKSQLLIESKRLEQLNSTQRDQLENLSLFKEQNQKYKYQIYELERELGMTNQESKEDLIEREKRNEKHLEKMKAKYTVNMKEKEDMIVEQESLIHDLKQTINQLEHDNQLQTNQLAELKQKLMDYKHLKQIIDKQSFEIRQQNEIIINQKSNIDQFNDELEGEEKENIQQIEKLEKTILNLEAIIDDQNVFIKKHKKIKDNTDHLYKYIKELQEENHKQQSDMEQQIQNLERELIKQKSLNLSPKRNIPQSNYIIEAPKKAPEQLKVNQEYQKNQEFQSYRNNAQQQQQQQQQQLQQQQQQRISSSNQQGLKSDYQQFRYGQQQQNLNSLVSPINQDSTQQSFMQKQKQSNSPYKKR